MLDGEVVIATRRGARLRGSAAPDPSGRLAGEDARRAIAGLVRRLGPAGAGRRGPRGPCPQGERRARLETGPRRRRAAHPPDARDPRSGDGGRLVRPVRGRRARRRRRQAARCARISRASGRCSRSSTSGRPTASSPASAGTRTGRARTSGRCCSACTTTTGTLHHVGITSSFTWDRRAALAEELAPLREGAIGRPSVARVGRMGRLRATPTRPASGCPARPRAGTAARTCRGSRSGSERVAEVAYDHLQGDRGSGTRPRSSAGDRTSRRRRAATTSSRRACPYLLASIFGTERLR